MIIDAEWFTGGCKVRVLVGLAVASFLASCPKSLLADQPPNIVYIISDDQSWTDFGFMGNPRVHTPHLDKLAKKSARFVNGYVPSSVCRPSLATLLTGLYPHQHGIHFNHGPPGNAGYNQMKSRQQYEATRQHEFELIRKQKSLPEVLRRELGYRSLQTGKFWEGHWRNGGFTEGMTTFEPPPSHQKFGGIRKLADGQSVAHGNGDSGLQIGRVTMAPIFRFIDNCLDAGDPWMVWYAPYLPHQPHDSPKRFYELASNKSGVQEHELPYFASIAQFDDTVGQIVGFIETKGLSDNTIFVFVSDNGWRPSQMRQGNRPQEFAHTHRSKRAPFDDGLRTPILIRWDGVIPPKTHNGLASSIDLMPTLLAAVEAKQRSKGDLPGMNLLPIAKGKGEIANDRTIFGEIYPGDATSIGHPERDIAYRWIRQGEMKLIVPHQHGQDKKAWGNYLDSIALFNVTIDPHETTNLATSPAQQQTTVRLHTLLTNWWSPSEPSQNQTGSSSRQNK